MCVCEPKCVSGRIIKQACIYLSLYKRVRSHAKLQLQPVPRPPFFSFPWADDYNQFGWMEM